MRNEVENYIESLRQEGRKAGNTCVSYRRDLLWMCGWLEERGRKDLSAVTGKDLEEMLGDMRRRGRAASSVSRMLASVKAFFSYELRQARVSEDPSKGMKTEAARTKERRLPDPEEVRAVVSAPRGYGDKAVRDRAMLALLCDAGLKVTELVELETEDLDLEGCRVRLKEKRRDAAGFTRHTAELLKDYLYGTRCRLVKDGSCSRLFTNTGGGAMSRQGCWKIIKSYGGMSPQDLRNYRVSRGCP